MTRPDNTAILTTHIAMLASCINQDYEDPEFIASSISKFSRKYMEENVYTKIKSIMSIHSVFQKLDPEAQEVLINCISSLRQEEDSKYSKPYFDSDIQSSIAGTVAEMETFSLLKAYFQYVFEFLDLHTDRSKFTPTNAEKKLKRLCSVWRAYVAVAESSAQGDVDSDSPVFKQCADFISTDKPYILKQMQKVYNVSIYKIA